MVQGIAAGDHIGIVSIAALRYAQKDGTSLVVPVRPAQVVHASFRHIQVLPDSRLRDGIPLYKLKLLDTLIGELSRHGAEGSGAVGSGAAALGTDAKSVDLLIDGMSKELRQGATGGYRTGFLPPPGAFVDLVA